MTREPDASVTTRTEAAYLHALAGIKGLGDRRLTRILLKYGSAEVVYKLQFTPSSPDERACTELIRAGADKVLLQSGYEIADKVASLGADTVSILDADYPLSLSQLPSAPPILYVLGELKEQDSYAVAVVGTRKASVEGKEAAHWLAGELASNGITVISGLARGIDTAAHGGALDKGGRTIAVIGTGLDEVYPPENKRLWASILDSGGAIISQFPPNSPPRRWQFPMRNRLMSGMAQGTVVVEAGRTSGAKLQAELAAEQGRIVFLTSRQVEKNPWAMELATRGDAIVVKGVEDVLRNLLSLEDLGRVPENLEVMKTLI